jgi:hypothetical protein
MGIFVPGISRITFEIEDQTLVALSHWERVGVRAYGGVNSSCRSVFECHSPLVEHE